MSTSVTKQSHPFIWKAWASIMVDGGAPGSNYLGDKIEISQPYSLQQIDETEKALQQLAEDAEEFNIFTQGGINLDEDWEHSPYLHKEEKEWNRKYCAIQNRSPRLQLASKMLDSML